MGHGKHASLAVLLERYGGAVRADLRRHYSGFSLTSLFNGEVTPDEVWDMIAHLPRTSALTAARLADPETVFSDDEDAEVPWQEWSPEAQRLDDIADTLAVISDQIAKFGTRQRVKVKPRKRPGEALRQRLKAQRREQARAEWNALLRQWGIPEV